MASVDIYNSLPDISSAGPQSIVAALEGPEGSGKSAFALSAPGPIYVAAFDPHGMNRVDPKFKEGKQIKIQKYGFNPNLYSDPSAVKKAGAALWKKFTDEFRASLPHIRTAIWDREDMAYKLQRYAEFGDTASAPSSYEDLYIDYVALIQEAYEAGVNLLLIRGLKEKWVSKFDPGKQKMVGHNTGEMIPSGMKSVPDQVDIVLKHRWDPVSKQYMTKIDKFTNAKFRGEELADLDFPNMAMMAYPNSDCGWWL